MNQVFDINQEWVLSKLELTPDEAYKEESLNLSGTYKERIRSLGRSLNSFHSLTSLDLSKNMLQSLKGMEHLKLLRNLNLYFNDISSLKELYRLRYNKQLNELDVRLNPVTKEEPDFRLFLVYMLPQLRQLDDRGVYDQEREAALLHFSSNQAHNFSFESPDPDNISVEAARNLNENQTHPRVKMVQRSVPLTHSALDEDDVTLLDLLSKSRTDAMPTPATHSMPAGNPFTDLEERVQSRVDDKSNFGQLFGTFLNNITEAIRDHWPDRVSVEFVDDLNGIVERNFSEICEKEDWIAKREEAWERELRDKLNLEKKVESNEEEKIEHDNKLKELAREISSLKSLENEHFPMKTAYLEQKKEYKQLEEKMNFHERRSIDLNERVQSLEYQNTHLENNLSDKRKNLEEALASLKEMRGLAAMLQETHKTLMANNNALLRENMQMKERHEQEVNQMHLSYQQLRKSFDVWKEANKRQ